MALTYKSNNIIEGLITDTKPTSNIAIGTIFIETNYTYPRAFRWNGTSWIVLTERGFDILRNKSVVSGEFFIRNGANGSGLFTALGTVFGAGAVGYGEDDDDSSYRYYGTGTAGAGTINGRATGSGGWKRKWKPQIYFISKVYDNTTATSTFVGLASVDNGTNLHATAPLPSQHGIGVGMLTNQSNYQIMHNDGDASATLVDTGVAKGTTALSCEIWTDDTNWYVSLEGDTSAPRTISTNIPAQTQALYATWGILTNDTTDRYFYIYKFAGQLNPF